MEILGSVLGVLFHEAVRVVRCFSAGQPIVPSAGLGAKVNAIIYGFAVAIFMLVAVLCTRYFANGNPYAGFLFGIGIPRGAGLIEPVKPLKQAGSDQADDFWSERHTASLLDRTRHWLQMYCV